MTLPLHFNSAAERMAYKRAAANRRQLRCRQKSRKRQCVRWATTMVTTKTIPPRRNPRRFNRKQYSDQRPFDRVLDSIEFWDGLQPRGLKLSTIVRRINSLTQIQQVELRDMGTKAVTLSCERRILLTPAKDEEPVHFFTVNTSTVPSSGLGLFAARNFKKGEYVGMYLGVEVTSQNSEAFNECRYVMTCGQDRYVDARNGINHSTDPRAYMGCHMMNDPTYGMKLDDTKWTTTFALVNVICHDNLLMSATRDIAKGEELFLSYRGDPEDAVPSSKMSR